MNLKLGSTVSRQFDEKFALLVVKHCSREKCLTFSSGKPICTFLTGELAINMKSNQNSITYPLKPPFFLEAAKLPPAEALSVVAFESGRQKDKKMKHSH